MTGSPPLVLVLGPTAVGKTGLAIALAQTLDGEIVNADSRQVYRYMDIGTAKPTAQQQAQAIHHLIDIVDPDDHLTLAVYQRLAYQRIEAIHARGKIPLLVGGTGQYITAVIEGWSIPEITPNPSLRAELEAFAAEHGAAALHARLKALDAVAAEKIHPNNIRRTVRALEVCLEAGQPISALQRKKPPSYRIRQYGLTMERDRLYARADRRLDDMLEQGFVEEVRRLLEMGYSRTLPSMSGLGYRELAAHVLDGVPLSSTVEATQHATHDFIRRQYTWFKGHDQGILWHNIETLGMNELTDSCARWLKGWD